MLKKIIIISLRILIGFVFCFSAFAKLKPIEPFEMIFVEMHVSGWEFAPILARIMISIEFLLGIFMILNLAPKIITKLVLLVLLFFTGYLGYILVKEGNTENCGCFGIMIKMNPIESILKNVILIGLTIILLSLKNTIALKWKFNKILIIGLILASLALPVILNPPNFLVHYDRPPEKTGYKLNINEMGAFNFQDSTYHLSTGNKIVCFFSMKCKFCKLAAHKLTIIQDRLKKALPAFYIFVGDNKNMAEFWKESKSFHFPNKIEKPDVFFKYSGNSLPAIYLLKNDTVFKKLNFDQISEDEIESFISE